MESFLRVYRIARAKYVDDLQGTGAYLAGGRWNSIGQHVIYTASSVSLAMLEILVHVSRETLPDDSMLATIKVPSTSIETIEINSLSKEWNALPGSEYTKEIGDKWIAERKSLILAVPSAINPLESNYLINPLHPLFKKVSIENKQIWKFDSRLI